MFKVPSTIVPSDCQPIRLIVFRKGGASSSQIEGSRGPVTEEDQKEDKRSKEEGNESKKIIRDLCKETGKKGDG